jgi:hypothetical protein
MVLAPPGASAQGVRGVFGRTFAQRLQRHHWWPCPTSAAGFSVSSGEVSGSQWHLIRVCGVSMNAPVHGSSNDTIGGRVRPRRPEISPVWFGLVQRPQRPLIRVYGVSMEAWLGSSNDTISGRRVRPRRPEISSSFHSGGPIGLH